MKKNASVLLVEDELIIAMFLKSELKTAGFEVCGHEIKGEKAITATESRNPDLIIMDIRLAGNLDGIDAALKIRTFSDCPIIFTSGYESENIKDRVSLVKRSCLLPKPLAVKQLEEALESLVN